MKTVTQKLAEGKVLVSDGAWGTFLQAKGLQIGECPELWNLTHPNDVFDIAESYIVAGADMIETNSFGGSRTKLLEYGLEKQTYEINKAASEISRKAAGNDRNVLGSIGPTGKMLMMEEITVLELTEVFKEQAIALSEGGADAIIVETMTDLEEAKIAAKAVKQNTNCEVIVTMTFDKYPNGFNTMMGVTPEQMVTTMHDIGIDIIGANCGNGVAGMIGIVKEIRRVNSKIPILIHANAGLPIIKDSKTIFPESPDEMSLSIPNLINEGANIVGGCCGTTPEHIRKIRDFVG